MTSPAVLGVDLSLTATGLSDGQRTWLVSSTGHRGDTLAIRSNRLSHLRTAVLEHAQGTALVVVEGPSHGQARQGGQHDRAGLWWHVVGGLLDTGTPVAEVPPATLKRYATGKGNAGKGAVIEATTRRYPQVLTDGDDNRCDALWLAVMGLDHLTGSGTVPQARRAALSAVVWPLAGAASAHHRTESGGPVTGDLHDAAHELVRTALLARLAVDLDDQPLARRAALEAAAHARLLAGRMPARIPW